MNTLFARAAAALVVALPAHSGQAQTYPVKPIRIVVGYTPGGGTDVIARVLAKYMSESFKQSVVVENRPGAGAILATELVAKAAPDGYTLMNTPSTHAINPGLYAKLPFDTIRDFTPISLIASSPNIIVVHPSLPARKVKELIALARSRPGELSFASAGVGSTTHLAGEYFRSIAKINTLHVPYKGSSQAEVDLATGQIHYMVDSTPAALPNVKSGRTRALATTASKRFSGLPDVPTVIEQGLDYESVSWWGIMGPAGMSQPLVERLHGEIVRIMSLPEVKKLVFAQGAETVTSTPQEFLDYIKRETALYTRIIKEAGIRIE